MTVFMVLCGPTFSISYMSEEYSVLFAQGVSSYNLSTQCIKAFIYLSSWYKWGQVVCLVPLRVIHAFYTVTNSCLVTLEQTTEGIGRLWMVHSKTYCLPMKNELLGSTKCGFCSIMFICNLLICLCSHWNVCPFHTASDLTRKALGGTRKSVCVQSFHKEPSSLAAPLLCPGLDWVPFFELRLGWQSFSSPVIIFLHSFY